jgi:TPR repeat protein
MCALALILKFGPDGMRDQRRAVELFKGAAEAGNSMATVQLADSIERGLGTEADESLARQWYFRAAQLNDEFAAAAHAAIASLYREGRVGLVVDPQKAEEWSTSSSKLLRDFRA